MQRCDNDDSSTLCLYIGRCLEGDLMVGVSVCVCVCFDGLIYKSLFATTLGGG